MPSPTYTLIASNVLGSSAASVTFSAIPQTYTDLVLRFSGRVGSGASTSMYGTFQANSNASTVYSTRILYGNGSSVLNDGASNRADLFSGFIINGSASTGNTFSSVEMYIPNYTSTSNKPISTFGVTETNATNPHIVIVAGLIRISSSLTSLTVYSGPTASPSDLFTSGSSFYLYGIKANP